MPPTFPASPEPAGHGQAPKKGLSPTCSVCHRSLLCERVFHQRYHVCPEHATATSVMLDGIVQRFCQQCGRFHPMDRFSPGMRSCRHQLARHAERRRKRRAEAAAAKSQAQRCSNNLDQLAEPLATGDHATLQGHTPSLTLPPPSKRLCMGPSSDPQHAAFPPLPAGIKSEPAGGQPDAQGSGRLSGGEGNGCASAQSTHSTHRHHSHGLDALLAAAEEEQQLEQQLEQQQQGGGSPAAAHIVAASQPVGPPQVAAHTVNVQPPLPLPALQQRDGTWQAMARGQQPQPRWQPPMLLVSQPVQQQQQQPLQQQHWPLLASYLAQAAAPTRQSYQPLQPAYQLQQLVQTAPAPPLLATQPQLLQLLQHLASPAASDALAALGVQLSAPPPPPATQPQQQQQPSLAAALASIQAAATQLYRPKPQPQPTSQHAALLQLVLQLAAHQQQ